jgi:signal transduction histidine kinase
MLVAPLSDDEALRIEVLQSYSVLDTLPEKNFDDITELASLICDMPIVLISFVDRERQWFKSKVGILASETPRDVAFCAHAILDPEKPFVVEDAQKDTRFADNPLVTDGPKVRFYAGAPLMTPEGYALGTLCLIDNKPRELNETQLRALTILSKKVIAELELRKSMLLLERNYAKVSKLMDALADSNRELEIFSQVASHDLQAPLRSIIGLSDLIDSEYGDAIPEEARNYLNMIKTSTQRMVHMVRDMLEYARLDKNPLYLTHQFYAQEELDTVLAQLGDTIKEKNAAIKTDALPLLYGNNLHFARVLQNLIGNALKYQEPHNQPIVSITCRDIGNFWQFDVQDNGIGIKPEFLEKIFKPFTRLHASHVYEGTGLGLAICIKIIERHGGTMQCVSLPDLGTKFTFTWQKR